jgi:hypothetical protein
LYQHGDYYINAFDVGDSVYYDVFLFQDELDCVVNLLVATETDYVDKELVAKILDNLTIDYLSDISQFDSSKFYIEDITAKLVSDKFNIHFKKPYMLTIIDSSRIEYVDIQDDDRDKYEFELDSGFYKLDDYELIDNYKNYEVYDSGSSLKLHFTLEDEYDGSKEDYEISISDNSYDRVKELFFE